jgi:hypothetical protein
MGCVVVRPDGTRIECDKGDIGAVLQACAWPTVVVGMESINDTIEESIRQRDREQIRARDAENALRVLGWIAGTCPIDWAHEQLKGSMVDAGAEVVSRRELERAFVAVGGLDPAEEGSDQMADFIAREWALARLASESATATAQQANKDARVAEEALRQEQEKTLGFASHAGMWVSWSHALRCLGWTGDCDPIAWAKRRTDEDVEAGKRVQEMGEEITRLQDILNAACSAANTITGDRPAWGDLPNAIEQCKAALLDAKRRYEGDLARTLAKLMQVDMDAARISEALKLLGWAPGVDAVDWARDQVGRDAECVRAMQERAAELSALKGDVDSLMAVVVDWLPAEHHRRLPHHLWERCASICAERKAKAPSRIGTTVAIDDMLDGEVGYLPERGGLPVLNPYVGRGRTHWCAFSVSGARFGEPTRAPTSAAQVLIVAEGCISEESAQIAILKHVKTVTPAVGTAFDFWSEVPEGGVVRCGSGDAKGDIAQARGGFRRWATIEGLPNPDEHAYYSQPRSDRFAPYTLLGFAPTDARLADIRALAEQANPPPSNPTHR